MVQDHSVGRIIEIGGLRKQHLDVFLFTQENAQRRRDFARGQRACRHLVQERLKEMEIPAID
jgi:hypothetical protein